MKTSLFSVPMPHPPSPIPYLLAVAFQRVGVADGDAVVAIDGDIALLFERSHHLVDSLARCADQAGDVALGQADGDRDDASGIALAVLAGERLDLARDAPIDIERAERLDAL